MKLKHSLGPLERKILHIIWKLESASVNEVQAELNKQKNKHLAYTTVMTILTRLVEKKVLTRKKEGRSYFYSPADNKDNFIHSLARKTIVNFVNRFGDEALAAFMDEAKKLSKEEKKVLLKELSEDTR